MKTRKARTVARPAIIEVQGDGEWVNVHINGKVSETETRDDYSQPMDSDYNYPQIPLIESNENYEFCSSQFSAAFGKQYLRAGIYPVVITIEAQQIGD